MQDLLFEKQQIPAVNKIRAHLLDDHRFILTTHLSENLTLRSNSLLSQHDLDHDLQEVQWSLIAQNLNKRVAYPTTSPSTFILVKVLRILSVEIYSMCSNRTFLFFKGKGIVRLFFIWAIFFSIWFFIFDFLLLQ